MSGAASQGFAAPEGLGSFARVEPYLVPTPRGARTAIQHDYDSVISLLGAQNHGGDIRAAPQTVECPVRGAHAAISVHMKNDNVHCRQQQRTSLPSLQWEAHAATPSPSLLSTSTGGGGAGRRFRRRTSLPSLQWEAHAATNTIHPQHEEVTSKLPKMWCRIASSGSRHHGEYRAGRSCHSTAVGRRST